MAFNNADTEFRSVSPTPLPTSPIGIPQQTRTGYVRSAAFEEEEEPLREGSSGTPKNVYKQLLLSNEEPEGVDSPNIGRRRSMDKFPEVEVRETSSWIESSELQAVREAEANFRSWKTVQKLQAPDALDKKRTTSQSSSATDLNDRQRNVSTSVDFLDDHNARETVLDGCKGVDYFRIHYDDPDLMDDEGESDIAKALVQALRLRNKYMVRSCQAPEVKEHFLYETTGSGSTERVSHKTDIYRDLSVSEFPVQGLPSQTKPADSSSSSTLRPPSSSPFTPKIKLHHHPCYTPGCRSSNPTKCYSPSCPHKSISFKMKNGVIEVHRSEEKKKQGMFNYPEFLNWGRDMKALMALIVDGPTKSFAHTRLSYLKKRFQMHRMLNETSETAEQKLVPHRDFYNIRKVDTHVHLSACMNSKHLVRFMKKKVKVEGDTVVLCKEGNEMTLKEVFNKIGLKPYELSVDAMDMHADRTLYHRFDRFNKKYNPIGESILREIFLKIKNEVDGRFYAEVINEVISDLEDSKYQHAEYRVSIYGKNMQEWEELADWFDKYDMQSTNVRWLIQTPRIFQIYHKNGILQNFEQMLENCFAPLFKATAEPWKYPKLCKFLDHVVGFDSVDDESKSDLQFGSSIPVPKYWTKGKNPPYSYYLYYFHANMATLNQFRRFKGMHTFVLRPHSGEAGSIDHLVAAFLSSEGISHGIMLRKAPVLQYLYYLANIGIAMSPLSNNSLFLDIAKNPFYDFFETGMFISLSTDDPVQFHMSKEPLIEEYAIARQVWKLSSTDLCELCSNSVRMSGFPDSFKRKWLGEDYELQGALGNDISFSNVPDIRVAYRCETMLRELSSLEQLSEQRSQTTI
eukprot:m.191547 g.191547  ORF g.191547 m.191547 type:complete len:853 (+) comp32435_c2_seq1:328-2886(+)